MTEALITVNNLTVAYSQNTVIKSANFTISPQDFVCVVGANGSGKSTLIKAILGLIKPASGEILFSSELPKNSIGFLPQDVKYEQYFPATVYEVVLSGTIGRFRKTPFYSSKQKSNAVGSLNLLHLMPLKDASFFELSGGQRQKVLLARALAATSKLLILDEPSNNLDQKSRQEFYQTLKKLNKSGLTIVMITHDLDADDLIGDKVLSIKDGKIFVETTTKYLRGFR